MEQIYSEGGSVSDETKLNGQLRLLLLLAVRLQHLYDFHVAILIPDLLYARVVLPTVLPMLFRLFHLKACLNPI